MLTSLTQHIYMNSLTHKVDLNVYITCTHYKFNSKVFDFYMTRTLTNITAITFRKGTRIKHLDICNIHNREFNIIFAIWS